MPVCAKCNKRTFNGTRWNSQDHSEFNGKYLCSACKSELYSSTNQVNKPVNEISSSNSPIMNKPTSAYYFSIIGGALGVIISCVLIGIGANLLYLYNTSPYFIAPHPVGQPDVRVFRDGLDYSGYWFFLLLGFWCLVLAIVILYSAKKLMANPVQHAKWGNTIIISSILGLGTIFGLIGGILAVSFKPDALNNQSQPITKICLQCGTVVNNSKFCPECGKEVVHKEATQNSSNHLHEATPEKEVENTRDQNKGASIKQTKDVPQSNNGTNISSPLPKTPKSKNLT
jgi:ribosomal protein L33